MSQAIKNLPLGSRIKDPFGVAPHGNKVWELIAKNHYGNKSVTLWNYRWYSGLEKVFSTDSNVRQYFGSTIDQFLSATIYNGLSPKLKSLIMNLPIKSNPRGGTYLTQYRRLFLLSAQDIFNLDMAGESFQLPYLTDNTKKIYNFDYWTRSLELRAASPQAIYLTQSGGSTQALFNRNCSARYAFSLPEDSRVTDEKQPDGTYHLVWNAPPTKPIIDTLSKEQGDPSVTSLTETIIFKTTDPEGDPIESINIVIADALTNSEVLKQTLNQSELSYTIPESTLQPNKTYSVKVRAKDNQQNWSEFSDPCYMISKLFTITLNKNVTLNDGDKIELIELSAITNAQEMTLKSIEKETDKYKFELDGFNDSTTVDLEIKGKASTLEDILYTVS
jgi:hypothetical protein